MIPKEMTFKKVDYTLGNLLAYVEQGDIGLPEIQRPFIWQDVKVRDLFDSLYRGYPIGYFLFWESAEANAKRTIALDGQKIPRLLVVDGQQRLTSLYAVIKDKEVLDKNGNQRRIKIAFRPRDQKFEVYNAAIQKDPEWIKDISKLWSQKSKQIVKDFFERLRKSKGLSEEEEVSLESAIDHLKNILHFPLVALELSANLDEEQVAEIFVRVNSTGTPLNQANFILTLMSVYWDEGRKDLEGFSAETQRPPSNNKSSPYNPLFQPSPDRLLRVGIALGFRRARLEDAYAILRGRDLQTREFSTQKREQQFQTLKDAQGVALDTTNWHQFIETVQKAGYKCKALVSSEYALLYTYALFLIGRRDFKIPLADLQKAIAPWFFMVSLTGRYTDSPESRMDQDLADLRGVSNKTDFLALLRRKIESELTPDFWQTTLPERLKTTSTQSPAFLAYLVSLILLDAKTFFSTDNIADLVCPNSKAPKPRLDRHHLFPKSYLTKQGIHDRREIDQVANLAFAYWVQNSLVIGAKPPAEYLPELRKGWHDEQIKQMYCWHALPDNWETMEYREFLEERRKLMAQIIKRGFDSLMQHFPQT